MRSITHYKTLVREFSVEAANIEEDLAEALGQPASPEQKWLIGELGAHLEQVEYQIDNVLSLMRGYP